VKRWRQKINNIQEWCICREGGQDSYRIKGPRRLRLEVCVTQKSLCDFCHEHLVSFVQFLILGTILAINSRSTF
jgi:hypothetical protein